MAGQQVEFSTQLRIAFCTLFVLLLAKARMGPTLNTLQLAISTIVRWMDGKPLPAMMISEGAFCALRIFYYRRMKKNTTA